MAISKTVYLDAMASASSSEFAIVDNFANPNSIHEAGREAFAVMEDAREKFAKLIGAKRPSEIIWTSGATEANNIAILGMARAIASKSPARLTPDPKRGKRNKIIVFEIEHESSLQPAKQLAREGFEVVVLPTDRNGFAKLMKFGEICDDETALVIMQHANTEIGSIQNVAEFCEIAHEKGALFHCDCVGSFGQVPLNVDKFGFDSASFSGHKIGAPKGIGALYLKANTPCQPIFFGGSQERGLRPGTQSVSLISAFVKVAEAAKNNLSAVGENYDKFNDFILTEISKLDGVRLTMGFAENKMGYLWNIISVVFAGRDSKNLILEYGKRGIIVAGGPACSSESDEPSHVLRAIGVGEDEIHGAIRISFCPQTKFEDVQAFIDATKEILSEN